MSKILKETTKREEKKIETAQPKKRIKLSYNSMSKTKLNELCKSQGLYRSGNKQQLVTRLLDPKKEKHKRKSKNDNENKNK